MLSDASPGPVMLSGLGYKLDIQMVRGSFELYALGGNFVRLRTSLAQHTAKLPFQKVDGLGTTTNVILTQMQSDTTSGVNRPIALALHRVVAAIHADVQARIDDGSVVVR